jgi:ferredoxin
VTLAVDPADSAGERLLLEAATLLGRRGEFKITRAVFDDRAASGIVLGRGTTADDQTGRVDVGVLLCPSTVDGLDGGAILSRLDRKSTLLLLAADEQPARTWDALGAVRRAWIKRRRPTLRWQRLSTSGQAASIVSSIEESWLRGAFETDAAYEEAERGWVEVGVPRPITLEIDLLDEARETPSGSVGAQIEQPRMPAVSDAPTKEFSSPALRQFHLTGSVGTTEPHSPQTGPLLPLAGLAIAAPADAWRSYPFVLDAGETDPRHRPLADLLTHAIGRAQDSTGSALAVIDRSRTTVLRLAHRLLSVGEAPAETADLLRATLQQLPQELDLSEAGTAELQREIERLEPWLELTGRPIAFDQGALLELFVETVRGRRDGPRERFRDEVRARVDRLDELLRIDDSHGPAGSTAQALSSTLGAGERFVDPAALSRNLPGYRGARPIEPARRARMEAAVARLRSWLDRAANEADLVLVHTGSTALDRTPARCRVIRHPDALRSAIGLFDGHAAAMVDTVRALRVARLDVEGQYDPARHDALIGRLGPHGFSAEEMLQLPAIVVIEDERRLAGDALTSFSALLRSGRPVLVLASRAATDPMAPQEDGAGYVPCTGYLAIAHREAFVVQSTLARPRQLVDGFSRMAVSLRPAVALVTRPQWGAAIAPWSQMVFAWHARNPSGFCYDPSAGATWAERFDLTDNPQPEAGWPEQEAAYVDGRGRPGSIPQRFTAVHAAATDPASGEQFRLLSSDAWAEDQIEIADYLDLPDKQQLRRIPYLWVVRHDGELARAVVTREQACLALDDLRAWRVLQELAGYHNEYARRAASIARDESRAAARVERAQLTARHSEAIEQVRAAAAGETIDRLVAVLMDLESVAPSAKIVTATPAVLPVETDAEQSASEPTETVADAIPSEEISFDEPYIDTVLCTTCNECTNLNPRLFVYNDNRQATINDPAAGTFEDLVKAAEKCPARCIHPGAPRADDPTVNDDLLTRARAFR